ncbi:MAG TPA: hypothetical protein VFX70_06230 [Mycobacteriales bacterium]|nr:hypothetical protein [Mycobacteriales bacterium]
MLAVTGAVSGAFPGIGNRGHSGNDGEPNANCTLIVPAHPLSARGLATPYQLEATHRRAGACHEATDAQSAFVQATILDPATGRVWVYDPLVTDRGTRPAVRPTPPPLPRGAVVGIWFGFNGTDLNLAGRGQRDGHCVNGLRHSIFGQFAFCNAPAFFTAANRAIHAHRLTIPPLGTATDGQPCPTTRDFSLIDQDQSDNVTTTYLVTPDGSTAQNTADNTARLTDQDARVAVNGSDNQLLDGAVDPALGCTPFTAPNLADHNTPATSLALNELQAAAKQAAPIALTPLIDPMTLDRGRPSLAKTNLYRAGVDQGRLDPRREKSADYCQNMVTVGSQRIPLDRDLTDSAPSPDPGTADSLYTFLAARLQGSYDNLNCTRWMHTDSIVALVTDADGVVVDAHFGDDATPTPTSTPTSAQGGSPSASPTATTPSASPTAPSASPTRPSPTASPTASPTKASPTPTASPSASPAQG